MKQAVTRTMQRGALGIKIIVGGRLGGAEMSRRETEKSGRVPLHTLRADIDYGTAEARTTFGRIGVKVWIYKGEILPELKAAPPAPVEEEPAEDTATEKEEETEVSRGRGRGRGGDGAEAEAVAPPVEEAAVRREEKVSE